MSNSNIEWEHSHDYGIDSEKNTSKVKVVFWLTTVIMVLEIVAGTWSGSMALLADGWHMGTHSAAFLITIFAYSYAKKHAKNKSFSFGTGKVNYLGGFASAVALGIVALMMAIESVQRLVEPQNIHFDEAIVVALIGLIVNVVSAIILKDDHHHHHHETESGHHHHGDDSHNHHHHHDHNLKAAYMHVLADTLTSVFAIIALLIGKYIGLIWLDSVMGIVGAVVIFHWSFGLIKESSSVLLDKSVDTSIVDKISVAMKDKGTVIHDIHVWKIANTHQAAILSVSSKEPLEIEEYKSALRAILPQLSHISIEVSNSSL